MKYLKESAPSGELFTSQSKVRTWFLNEETMIWFLNEAFYCKDNMSEQFELGTSNWPKLTLSTYLTSNVVNILTWFPLGMPEEKHILMWVACTVWMEVEK